MKSEGMTDGSVDPSPSFDGSFGLDLQTIPKIQGAEAGTFRKK